MKVCFLSADRGVSRIARELANVINVVRDIVERDRLAGKQRPTDCAWDKKEPAS